MAPDTESFAVAVVGEVKLVMVTCKEASTSHAAQSQMHRPGMSSGTQPVNTT